MEVNGNIFNDLNKYYLKVRLDDKPIFWFEFSQNLENS